MDPDQAYAALMGGPAATSARQGQQQGVNQAMFSIPPAQLQQMAGAGQPGMGAQPGGQAMQQVMPPAPMPTPAPPPAATGAPMPNPAEQAEFERMVRPPTGGLQAGMRAPTNPQVSIDPRTGRQMFRGL
jgi:hypothetical protein